MANRITIVALVLIAAIVSSDADGKAAAPTATPTAAGAAPTASPTTASAAPGAQPDAAGADDKPLALTPFAQSPGMSASLQANDTQLDDDDAKDDSLLGAPTPAATYGPRDADAGSSAAAALGVSSAAAVSTAAAVAAGSLFF